jgi:hypothetical protein
MDARGCGDGQKIDRALVYYDVEIIPQLEEFIRHSIDTNDLIFLASDGKAGHGLHPWTQRWIRAWKKRWLLELQDF